MLNSDDESNGNNESSSKTIGALTPSPDQQLKKGKDTQPTTANNAKQRKPEPKSA